MDNYTLAHEIDVEKNGEFELDLIFEHDDVETIADMVKLLETIDSDCHYQYLVFESAIDADGNEDSIHTRGDEWLEAIVEATNH